MAMPSFIFDPSRGETPEAVARKRAIVEALMGRIGGRPAKTVKEGIGSALASVGHGIAANVMGRRADRAEQEGRGSADALYSQIIQSLTQGKPIDLSTAPMDPAGGGIPPQTGDVQPYLDAIASIESAGSGDYSAIGPTHDKLGRALGRYQVMEANIGPWSQEALGRAVTPDEFLSNPQIQDAIAGHRFQQYLQQFGDPALAAQAWFAGPGGVGTNRKDVLGTSVPEYAQRFMSALQPTQAQLESLPVGGQMQMPPAMPAGGPDPVQTAQASPDLQALLEAAANPWLNEGQRAVINQLLKQVMDPAYGLDMEYKRAQIDKLRSDAAGGMPELGLNPQYGVDEEGNPVILQLSKDGRVVKSRMPEGVQLSKEPIKMDAGTHFVLLDPITRQPVGAIPKNNYEAEFEKAQGREEGKDRGEARARLETDLATAEQAMREIDELANHPGLSSILGPLDQYRPSWSMGAQGRDALARYNQAKGRAFLQAYATLKGGGQITEIEGIKAEQAMARMDRAQDEAEFRQALKDFRDAIETGMRKLRERAGVSGSAPVSIGGYTIEQVD